MNNDFTQFIQYKVVTISSSGIVSELIHKTYEFISFLNNVYPRFDLWFYEKVIPGLKAGEREIFCAIEDDNIIGVAIVKKTTYENKICTLYVDKSYRGRGVGMTLVRASVDWLQTNTPKFSAPLSVNNEIEFFFKKTGLIVVEKQRLDQTEVMYN